MGNSLRTVVLTRSPKINIKMLKHVVFCAIFSSLEAMNLSGNNLMIGGDLEQNGDHELVRRSSGNDQNRPEVIYITPDNVDSVIQTLRLPSYRELRKRSVHSPFLSKELWEL